MWFGKQTQIKLQQSVAEKEGAEANSDGYRNVAKEKVDLFQYLDIQRMSVHDQNPAKNSR